MFPPSNCIGRLWLLSAAFYCGLLIVKWELSRIYLEIRLSIYANDDSHDLRSVFRNLDLNILWYFCFFYELIMSVDFGFYRLRFTSTSHMILDIWSIWQRSIWRSTMSETGLEWLRQTKIEVFMNWGTSTLPRTRVRKKINCMIGFVNLRSLFTLFPRATFPFDKNYLRHNGLFRLLAILSFDYLWVMLPLLNWE